MLSKYTFPIVFACILLTPATAPVAQEKSSDSGEDAGNLMAFVNLGAVDQHEAHGTVLVRRLDEGVGLELEFEDVPAGRYSLVLRPHAECSGADVSAGKPNSTEAVASAARADNEVVKLGAFQVATGGELRDTIKNSELSVTGEQGMVGRSLALMNLADADDESGPILACGVVEAQGSEAPLGTTPTLGPGG